MADKAPIRIGLAADLPPGARQLVFVPGAESVVVLNVAGRFHALDNSCPHAGAAIAGGSCDGHTLQCPAHGLRFHLHNGQCTASPEMAIPVHAVVEQGGVLWLSSQAGATEA